MEIKYYVSPPPYTHTNNFCLLKMFYKQILASSESGFHLSFTEFTPLNIIVRTSQRERTDLLMKPALDVS